MPRRNEDVRGELVETYKLTPEQMKFQKRFKQLKQMQELMQARSLGLALQLENERALWEKLEGEFRQLRAPERNIMELPGMNFKEQAIMQPGGMQPGQLGPQGPQQQLQEGEGRPPWHLKY